MESFSTTFSFNTVVSQSTHCTEMGGLGSNQVPHILYLIKTGGSASGGSCDDLGAGKAMFDALYVNRRQLEAMFAFFDKDNNGSISR